MKALVTGGAGFIGSNVVKKLIDNHWEVRVLDDLSSGHVRNLKSFDVDFRQGDIRVTAFVEQACKGVDVVFHLAASVGRQKSLDHPQVDSEINLLGTVNVLEGMRKHNVPKIVYSSSAAIFGELLTSTIDENHPQNADSPYGVSKLAAEKMILAYGGIYGIKSVCLRYFNIYGVNQRYDLYGNVIPIFAQRLHDHKPIIIYGDGTQTRDFLNVWDVAEANHLAANLDQTGVYNLGSGASITILQLADWMQEIKGRQVGIQYLPKRPADVMHCKANTIKARSMLGFYSKVPLLEGLTEYLDWFERKDEK
jgi:UDP-glucose 4-epimerase